MKKLFIAVLVLAVALLSACAVKESNVQDELQPVSIMTLKGPAGMGMVKMIDEAAKDTNSNYSFQIVGSPDVIVAALSNGQADVAALPSNLAAKLYNKTDGEIILLAINNLGSLYILENGNTINSFSDLQGKTIYATGQGANPQYILEFLLAQSGLEIGKDVNVVYKSEHSELAALMASDEVDIAMLPEPFISTVISKNPDIRIALDLNDQWQQYTGTKLSMSSIVARKSFVKANKQTVTQLLKDLAASSEYAENNVSETAKLCAQYGIIDNAAIAKQSIPNCGLTFISGKQMETALKGYYSMLLSVDQASIGGELPKEDFYYTK